MTPPKKEYQEILSFVSKDLAGTITRKI